jgi:hypothetical protein
MPAAFKRCVKEVKGAKNPYAVCTAANAGGIKQVRKQEAAARHAGKRPK